MNNRPYRSQTHPGRNLATGRRSGFLLLAVAILLLLATCGSTPPTVAPISIVAAETSTPEISTASQPTESPTLPPTPVATSTPTLAPTETPELPTATTTPSPTATLPPPTHTPAPPTRTPASPTAAVPPAPTMPPMPQYPWRGQVVGTFSNCALTRLMGLTLDRNGGIAGGLWVFYWADGWEGAWAQSSWDANEGYEGLDDSSNWDGILGTYAKPGTWHTCLVPSQGSRECLSPTVTAQTVAEPCTPDSGGAQIVRIVFRQN